MIRTVLKHIVWPFVHRLTQDQGRIRLCLLMFFLLCPSVRAQSFKALLPDYFAYLELEKVCCSCPERCVKKTDQFLRTFQTPYLVTKVKVLRFKALCTSGHDAIAERVDEIVSLAPLVQSNDVLSCARLLEREFPDRAALLYRLVFLRGDREFLKVKVHYFPYDLNSKELQRVITGLIKVDYERPYNGLKEARDLLLKLKEMDFEDRNLLYSLLGTVYMRMRHYPEAAEAFLRANMYYQAASAYLRADMTEKLNDLIRELLEKDDPEAYRLLLLKAERLRRLGQIAEAEDILWKVYKFSEKHREEALWGLAWMAYLQRDLYSSMARLKRLQSRWPKDRYAYWLRRTLEKMGKNAALKEVPFNGVNFYAILEKMRSNMGTIEKVAYQKSAKPEEPVNNNTLERAWALRLLGEDELSIEEALWQFSNGSITARQACEFFRQSGAWWMMPWCQNRLPQGEAIYFRYPFAYPEVVDRVAKETGVDPLLILSVMKQESRFNPKAISRSGAMGLMQLMPFTAKRFLRTEGPIHRECFKVERNILAGARYLRFLIDKFKSTALAVTAYNAGEGSVSRWLEAFPYEAIDEFIEDIPYGQTYHYTQRVLFNYYHYQKLYEEVFLKKEP